MHGHNADCRCLLTGKLRRTVVSVVFFQIVNIAHKVAESAVPDALKLLGLHNQHLQIRKAELSARARCFLVPVVALCIQKSQKLREFEIALRFPPGLEFPEERGGFHRGRTLRRCRDSRFEALVETHALPLCRKRGKLLFAETADRRAEHSCERNIAEGIIDRAE